MVYPQHGHGQYISTKDHDWPNFFRLVSISGIAILASVGNIFTISSIIVDDLLRKKGNSFLVSITLSDLLVTSILIPSISVAILAQTEDSENLCLFQYGMGCMSCVTASIFTAAIGIENFVRLRALKKVESARLGRLGQPVVLSVHIVSQPSERQSVCSKLQMTLLSLTFWSLAGIVVLFHVGFMPHLAYTICNNESPANNGNFLFDSVLVLGAFLLLFMLLGGLGFLKCICIMRSWSKPLPYITSREFALITSNIWNWLARFIIWCPSIVAAVLTQFDKSSSMSLHELMPLPTGRVSLSTTTTITTFTTEEAMNTTFSSSKTLGGKGSQQDANFVTLQRLVFWSAILPSCVGCLIYACANKDFRRCYIQLFNYCCCKTSVTLSRRTREIRGGSDVRTHMIPGYNIYSSGHNEVAATPPRFNTFKCGPIMSYRREVYEL